MSFPNKLWKFKWEIYWESEFTVSPGAFSDGQAAGRDQTWANVWKRLSTTRWEVSAGKTDASHLAFKGWEQWGNECQGDLLNGDPPCSEVFILIAGLFFQLTDHLRWPCGFKKRYFKLYQLHISVLSPLRECFASQEDLLQLPCFFRTVLILFVWAFLGCYHVGCLSQQKLWSTQDLTW